MKTPLLFLHFLICCCCFGQDTIKVGPSIFYSAEEAQQLTRKGFQGNYAREDIIFSDKFKRIEFCYYVDSSQRNCVGTDYKIVGDSTLLIGDIRNESDLEKWCFKKMENGNYFLHNRNNGVIDFGEVKKLIPLSPVHSIYTTSLDGMDTLWATTYLSNGTSSRGHWKREFYKSKIDGKVYEYDQVDSPPTQVDGTPLVPVDIQGVIPCFSNPIVDVTTIAIIVTKEGNVKNIEQAIGGLLEGCTATMEEIIKEIKNWGKLKPAIRKGKEVNVRWFVSINNLEREYIHPVYEDNRKNRKRYIRKKKRQSK